MRKTLFALILFMCSLHCTFADDAGMQQKIVESVKIQGTVTGENIKPAAIIDDLIAREGDVFLVDSETGNLQMRLGASEAPKYAPELQVKIIAVTAGSVVLQHNGTHLVLVMNREED